MTDEQVKKALEEGTAKRVAECNQEVAKVLEQYNCILDAMMILKPGKQPDLYVQAVSK